ncbi:uncharacterized protein FOMMEDRAFT_17228 [Fomitiporia mediterranea MF3/22]|uniref:uncharacterized protein n=1 Tax=Fomitiporia mediterranea (strain MF3/22) TaxID=694068 RepID=UPI0004408156|nr:uncharacterized protein FOMMEDRAFT_17228 [Fomitiporia mediterranea MF3/22]EJD06765.1 hypothetical protein FOMMEDRAFT_17228 [Fomitiporia mediterranea MF3/22]
MTNLIFLSFLSFLTPPHTADPNERRKRRSRWGEAKAELPGLPTAISANGVSQAQLDTYAIHLRLEEINRKLRLNDFIPPERERSPSPPPVYDAHGRRTNTREVRYRKKLEEERIKLVDRALKVDPNFRPPVEYHQQKRSQRPSEKVYIPTKEFPEINFFGLLVGPRGNSLKKMERESGAKISIRGKGSVKEGKGKPDQFADDAEEDLHCLVMADSEEKVATCVKLINRVIETAASTPEGQNDHKRNQLRELAALNGTLRDDENQICQNCGEVGHRKYDCPEQKNFTANIICRVCGSAGHMARDCQVRPDLNGSPDAPPAMNKGNFDSEYANLMAELGESGAGAGTGKSWGGGGTGLSITAGGSDVPPWRRPEMWQSTTPANQNTQNGYRPPQGYSGAAAAGYGGGYGGTQAWYQGAGYPQGYGGQDYSAAYAQYYQQQYNQSQTPMQQ